MSENDNDLKVQVARLEERSKSNSHRIDNLTADIKEFHDYNKAEFDKLHEEYKVLYELSASIKSLSQTVIATNEKIDDVKLKQDAMAEKINTLENAPAKEALTLNKEIRNKIIIGIVLGVIGFFMGSFLPFSL